MLLFSDPCADYARDAVCETKLGLYYSFHSSSQNMFQYLQDLSTIRSTIYLGLHSVNTDDPVSCFMWGIMNI